MRMHRLVLVALLVLAAGCSSGDDESSGGASSGSIGSDEVNRYEIDVVGTITFTHTGGLICKVVDGDLLLDFSIDASDGDYEYEAVLPGFDPTSSQFEGDFLLTYQGEQTAAGTISLAFGYGPAPDDFPGVVRAAGNFAGPISGDAGTAEIAGSYACFLMDSEVGN